LCCRTGYPEKPVRKKPNTIKHKDKPANQTELTESLKVVKQPRKRALDVGYDTENTPDLNVSSIKRKRTISPPAKAVVEIDVLDLTKLNKSRGEDERGPPAIRKLKKLHIQTQNVGNITLPKFKSSNIRAIEGQPSQNMGAVNEGPGNGFWDVKLPSLSELLAGTQQSVAQQESSEVSDILGRSTSNEMLELFDQHIEDPVASILV